MTGYASCSGGSLAGFGIAGDHGARERVLHGRGEAGLGRTVVVQIFVQRRGNGMLDGGFNCVGGKSGSNVFAEAFGSATMSKGLDTGPGRHASNSTFPNSRLFPVF